MSARMDDIDDFLDRVSAVEAELKRLAAGEDGDGSVESRRGASSALAGGETVTEEPYHVRKARSVASGRREVQQWWRHAAVAAGMGGGEAGDGARSEPTTAAATGAATASSPSVAEGVVGAKGTSGGVGGGVDYSKWDRWAVDPDDPVTREEERRLKEEEERRRDEAFEKANPAFCSQFKSDMAVRREAEEKKAKRAAALKEEGNDAFKRQQYGLALSRYASALQLDGLNVAVLNNVAAVHLAQANRCTWHAVAGDAADGHGWDASTDAAFFASCPRTLADDVSGWCRHVESVIDYTSRVLLCQPGNVKARYRRWQACHALAQLHQGRLPAATTMPSTATGVDSTAGPSSGIASGQACVPCSPAVVAYTHPIRLLSRLGLWRGEGGNVPSPAGDAAGGAKPAVAGAGGDGGEDGSGEIWALRRSGVVTATTPATPPPTWHAWCLADACVMMAQTVGAGAEDSDVMSAFCHCAYGSPPTPASTSTRPTPLVDAAMAELHDQVTRALDSASPGACALPAMVSVAAALQPTSGDVDVDAIVDRHLHTLTAFACWFVRAADAQCRSITSSTPAVTGVDGPFPTSLVGALHLVTTLWRTGHPAWRWLTVLAGSGGSTLLQALLSLGYHPHALPLPLRGQVFDSLLTMLDATHPPPPLASPASILREACPEGCGALQVWGLDAAVVRAAGSMLEAWLHRCTWRAVLLASTAPRLMHALAPVLPHLAPPGTASTAAAVNAVVHELAWYQHLSLQSHLPPPTPATLPNPLLPAWQAMIASWFAAPTTHPSTCAGALLAIITGLTPALFPDTPPPATTSSTATAPAKPGRTATAALALPSPAMAAAAGTACQMAITCLANASQAEAVRPAFVAAEGALWRGLQSVVRGALWSVMHAPAPTVAPPPEPPVLDYPSALTIAGSALAALANVCVTVGVDHIMPHTLPDFVLMASTFAVKALVVPAIAAAAPRPLMLSVVGRTCLLLSRLAVVASVTSTLAAHGAQPWVSLLADAVTPPPSSVTAGGGGGGVGTSGASASDASAAPCHEAVEVVYLSARLLALLSGVWPPSALAPLVAAPGQRALSSAIGVVVAQGKGGTPASQARCISALGNLAKTCIPVAAAPTAAATSLTTGLLDQLVSALSTVATVVDTNPAARVAAKNAAIALARLAQHNPHAKARLREARGTEIMITIQKYLDGEGSAMGEGSTGGAR